MDWYLHSGDLRAVPALRRQVISYLSRHARPESRLDDAAIVVSELLTNAVAHTAGPAWVTLNWDGQNPILTVADLGPGFDPAGLPEDPLADRGRGLFIAARLARKIEISNRDTGGTVVSATLDIDRAS
jgi:anti-sigma regulatory factor (Ser/Thr protein kinase)